MKFEKHDIKLIILSGKAHSGKSLVADMINDYYGSKCISISYAYYIKDYLSRMNRYSDSNKEEYRSLMQDFGIKLLHDKIDHDFLINRVCEDIEVFSYFYDVIVISDARMLPEIEIPKSLYKNVTTIRVTSNLPGICDELKNHITEVALDKYDGYDYIIDNNGSRDECQGAILLITGPGIPFYGRNEMKESEFFKGRYCPAYEGIDHSPTNQQNQ